MTTQPRRWFPRSFGLRTLFIVVTVLGCALGWLVWQVQIVRERNAVMAQMTKIQSEIYALDAMIPAVGCSIESFENDPAWDDVVTSNSHLRVPTVRRLLGDKSYILLEIPASLDKGWLERAEVAFPEAELFLLSPSREQIAYRDSLYEPAADREPNQGNIFKTGLIEKQP